MSCGVAKSWLGRKAGRKRAVHPLHTFLRGRRPFEQFVSGTNATLTSMLSNCRMTPSLSFWSDLGWIAVNI
jgi:hypothetical protein